MTMPDRAVEGRPANGHGARKGVVRKLEAHLACEKERLRRIGSAAFEPQPVERSGTTHAVRISVWRN
jgi:hypothetical protein